MPKMKNKRAALKRFSLTATGKIRFKKSGLRHNMGNKSSDRKRKKGIIAYVNGANYESVMRCMPYR